jgi:hypothetical protein
MKKTLALSLLVLGLIGCSENKITVDNLGDYDVFLNFRAESYKIPANTSNYVATNEIPNGTFNYTSTITCPASYTAIDGGGLTGNWTFSQGKTEIRISYGGTYNDTLYTVSATWTSTSPSSMPTQ